MLEGDAGWGSWQVSFRFWGGNPQRGQREGAMLHAWVPVEGTPAGALVLCCPGSWELGMLAASVPSCVADRAQPNIPIFPDLCGLDSQGLIFSSAWLLLAKLHLFATVPKLYFKSFPFPLQCSFLSAAVFRGTGRVLLFS